MLGINDIKFFITIAGSATLSIAAKQLNVSAPYVTQKLKALEEKLGVSLLERRGRQFVITDYGKLIQGMGTDIIRKMDLLEESLRAAKEGLQGHLNIHAPIGFGDKKLSPIVGEFKKQYPGISIDLILSDCPSWDGNPFQPDIMFYIGELTQSRLYRKVLSSTRRILCASPEYIVNMPFLDKPEDLVNHSCIVLKENNEDTSLWRFLHKNEPDKEYNIRVTASLTSNIADVVKQWALDGLGIINRSKWDIVSELNDGRLIELLSEYDLPQVDIVALMATKESMRSHKINVFLEFAQRKLQDEL